jgi:putative MATE family efflux protein
MSVSVPVERPASFLQSIKEAISGTQQDFTEGSIGRAVLLLATPMVLEMVMESLFAIVNVFWVTRLGVEAVAVVGLTESMLTLVFAVAVGVGMSTTAMVARRIGEKDRSGAATAAGQAILLGIAISKAVGLPSWLFAGELLGLMGADTGLIAAGESYTAISLGSSLVIMLLFLNNSIFRGAGDAAIAMRVLWMSNLVNLALDPCLIFGLGPFPEMGLKGAAISTLIGRSLGVLYQFWILLNGKSRIKLRLHDMRANLPVLKSLTRVSATGVLQFAISHTSWIALVRMISSFGGIYVAGYTIGIRIFIFAVLPSWGFSGAAATMVGQSLGAKKPERAVKAVFYTAMCNVVYLGAVAIVFVFWPEVLVRLFTTDAAIEKVAVDCLRIVGYGNVIYAFGMVLVQAFNGAGDTVTPTLINVIGFWMFQIPLAWFLAFHAGWNVNGVFYAIPLTEVLITALSLIMFLSGKWKKRMI